jgi:hypothetical protein
MAVGLTCDRSDGLLQLDLAIPEELGAPGSGRPIRSGCGERGHVPCFPLRCPQRPTYRSPVAHGGSHPAA